MLGDRLGNVLVPLSQTERAARVPTGLETEPVGATRDTERPAQAKLVA